MANKIAEIGVDACEPTRMSIFPAFETSLINLKDSPFDSLHLNQTPSLHGVVNGPVGDVDRMV